MPAAKHDCHHDKLAEDFKVASQTTVREPETRWRHSLMQHSREIVAVGSETETDGAIRADDFKENAKDIEPGLACDVKDGIALVCQR